MLCRALGTIALAAGLSLLAGGGASAACTLPSTSCYPWRIEAGQSETVLLEIVPNNAPTGAIYRVCLCPPSRAVSVEFDFEGRQVSLGTVDIGSGQPICRGYRIQTGRKSRLVLRRAGNTDGTAAAEGCYTSQ